MAGSAAIIPAGLRRDRELAGTPVVVGRASDLTDSPVPQGDPATTHPQYIERVGDWLLMRHSVRGETAIKGAMETHLPMPSAFTVQADSGMAMYSSYLDRAQFPDLVGPTLVAAMGLVGRSEPEVEMPEDMEYLWEDCDGRGTPLEVMHRRLLREVMETGRAGLLADAPTQEEGGGEPYIRLYSAETLINWSEAEDFFVLQEQVAVRDGFVWKFEDNWRVLELTEEGYRQIVYDTQKNPGEPYSPAPAGRRRQLDKIPFTVVGPQELGVAVDDPPLIGIARIARAIYRLDADYRHQLYMTGQETFVTTGLSEDDSPRAVGAGVIINLPAGATAEYVSPSGKGIEAHKAAIAEERDNAAALGARLFDTNRKQGVESGEALRIRVGSTTASLRTVALSAAAGLESGLRDVARLRGKSDAELSKIIVTPDLSWLDKGLTPQEASALKDLWKEGSISYETLYWNLQRGEIASKDRTAEEEQELIDQETPEMVDPALDPALGGLPATGEEGEVPLASDEELAEMFDPALLKDL